MDGIKEAYKKILDPNDASLPRLEKKPSVVKDAEPEK